MIKMNHLAFGLLVLTLAVQAGARDKNSDFSPLTEVPLQVRQALSAWNHQFQLHNMSDFGPEVLSMFSDLSKSAPMRTLADFNGDGILDYAFTGRGWNQNHLIAVISGPKWRVIEVEKWSNSDSRMTPIYLTAAEGPLAQSFKAQYKRSAIQLEAYFGEVKLFGFKNQKIVELID